MQLSATYTVDELSLNMPGSRQMASLTVFCDVMPSIKLHNVISWNIYFILSTENLRQMTSCILHKLCMSVLKCVVKESLCRGSLCFVESRKNTKILK
jgi:hypothetical protein